MKFPLVPFIAAALVGWHPSAFAQNTFGNNAKSGKDSQSNSAGLEVLVPAPVISSVTPNPVTGVAKPGRVNLTLRGANFVNKSAILLSWTGGTATLSSQSVTFVSSNRVEIAVVTNTTADKWTVMAINPDGQKSNRITFRVLAPTPAISSVTPKPVTGVALTERVNLTLRADVDVPILTVQSLPGGKIEGRLHTCSIGITKRSGQQPLAVSVTENSPSAVGAQFRAAIWLAATTVALERGDPLTGYRIDASFEGSIDGPSAGGVIALALMSVLDHRNLPQDFAFTGTILPNGGVGQVGGVVQKIQAAAKAGKKRVLVPALYRVDTDMNTGKKVDFKDLCESLGMEFVPITNIHDAYLSIYKLDVVQQPLSSLKLPQKIEGILKDAYTKEVARGDRIYDAIPAAEQAELKQDTLFQKFIKARSDAENYMRAGNFVLAAEHASMWSIALAARNRNVNLIFKLNASSLEELIEGLSKELKRATKDVFDDAASYRQMRSWTSKVYSSELDDYCRELPVFLGMSEAFGFKEHQLLEYRKTVTDVKEGFFDKFKSGPSKKDKLAEIDQERFAMKVVQLLFINIADLYRPVAKSSMESYANIYNESSVKVEAFHRNSENIVYNAAVAADGSFTTDAIQEIAKGSGIDIDSAKAQMAMNSLPYLSLVVQRKFCDETHRTLGTNADLYSLALATQDHSFALTAATRLMLMVQCGQDTDADGNMTYSNNGLVRSLLESSRTEALIAIAKCEASSIPCLNPIMLILGADGKREDVTEDRMDVLEAYLQAGMQARILRLLFSNGHRK